jgi:hypothetical protein
MKKIEKLSKFGIQVNCQNLFVGGTDVTSSASTPTTTFVEGQTNCSDSQTVYDNDNGSATGKCTTYTCK